jgi:hypothetical protein
MDSKVWYASKTMWANLLVLIAAASTALGVDLGLDIATQGVLVAAILAVVNIVLRFTTKTAVTVTRSA